MIIINIKCLDSLLFIDFDSLMWPVMPLKFKKKKI